MSICASNALFICVTGAAVPLPGAVISMRQISLGAAIDMRVKKS